MNKLKNISRLIKFLSSLVLRFVIQDRFSKRLINKYLAGSGFDKENSAESKSISKAIIFGSTIPLIAEEYAYMTRVKLSKKTRELITYVAALSAIADTLLDKGEISTERLDEMIKGKGITTPSPLERVMIDFYHTILSGVETKQKRISIEKIFMRIHSVQILSIKQKDPLITENLQKEIAKEKGLSYLLMTKFINPTMSQTEEESIHNFGYWLQLVDDYADQNQDRSEGINTLFNSTNITQDSKDRYLLSIQHEAFQSIMSLNYSKKRKEDFLFRFYTLSRLHVSNNSSSADSDRKFNDMTSSGASLNFITRIKHILVEILSFQITHTEEHQLD